LLRFFFFTVDQNMDGRPKTSTHVATKRVQLSPYLRLKMETASVATPKLSGHLRVGVLKILLPCSSTSHNKGTSHTSHKRSMRLGAGVAVDLGLLEVMHGSYVHVMNHSMVTIIAVHMQIRMVTRSPCRMARTCWQIRVVMTSQYLNLKSGKLNTL
jgi:hypothetical protein